MSEFSHIPVLRNEAIEALAIREEGIYIDATVGLGGYTRAIADKVSTGKVIGLDADSHALAIAEESLAEYGERIILKHSNFRYIERIISEMGIVAVDGIVADLGLSSMELDDTSRGFSFRENAPLDMRFDIESQDLTAGDIVNTYSQDELTTLFKTLADEPFSGRIARVIVESRKIKKIETTQELADIIVSIVPKKFAKKSIHPATRVFQALRMEVNDEIGALKSLLSSSLPLLNASGRLAIVSFHSGEDRTVKQTFREWREQGWVSILTKKPIIPTDEELGANPRSRSAKLRIIEKS
jgi:16S rRNA (cytosine1402-N4)-methyltransferase